MNQTVIFSVGIVVFALTIWGAVMAGSVWLGKIAEAEDERTGLMSRFNTRDSDEIDGTPSTTSQ